MKNLEAKKVVTEDKYAYMNAETFKEFLKLYPYENNYEWAGMLLKWLIFTYIDNFETFRRFASLSQLRPHRLAWCDGEIDIYEDNSVLDFIYEVDNGRGDTICGIGWYWSEDDIVEPLFTDRANMTEDDKWEWEESYYDMTWLIWRVVDDGKTAGEKIMDAIFSKQGILDAILEWTEKNTDKLQ